MFRVIKVDENNKRDIIEQLKSDLLFNAYNIYDLLYEPNKTVVYVGYEGNSFKGYLLLYSGFDFLIAWLYGDSQTASSLMDLLPQKEMVLHCPTSLLNIVKQRFPDALYYLIDLMAVSKGEEQLISPNPAIRLSAEHSSQLTKLYSSGEARFTMSEERYKERLEKRPYYCVFYKDELVSVAFVRDVLPEVWVVGGVFTHPQYRGRGFATLTTSAVTEEALKHTNTVILFVGSDNIPAVRLYQKLGYKTVNQLYWVDIGTGRRP